jgi:hypothetical protein
MRAGSKKNHERDFFEMDRSVLIDQLKALKQNLRGAVTEIEMIAAEAVFDKRLSAQLKLKARALNRTAESLNTLGKVLARAKFPKPRK